MLRILRNKLLLINAVSIAVVIWFSFAAVYKSVDTWVDSVAEEAIERAIEEYEGSVPALSRALPKAEELNVTVIAVDEGYEVAENDNVIEKISVLPDGSKILARCDITTENDMLRRLASILCVVGVFAVLLVVFVSAVVANKAIEPVWNSIKRQKQFVTDASHELKTPLAALSATMDILPVSYGQEKWINNIRYEIDRMIRLTSSLLKLSKFGTGDEFSIVNMSEICTFAVLSFEVSAFEKDVLVKSSITENVFIRGCREQLEQLVVILMDNAIKYNCKGGFVKIDLSKKGRQIKLLVENTGESINEEDRKEIFERFYRGDKSRSSEGFGLGLAIAKEIVEAHKGKISVSGNETTVFTVIL